MPPPTVAASALDGLLLDPAEINSAMGATEMTVSETSKQMWDSSGEISDRACVPVYGAAEYDVYTGTGFSAVRYMSLQEPGDDPPHFAEQAVVAFPDGDDAAKFFADSEENWAGCADRRYTLRLPDYDVDTLWTVGQVSTTDGILTASMLMEDGDGWGCHRAMTVGSNVVIDVTICGYNEADEAAVTIARDIAGKLPKG
ncbi:sensor domain-containing protein [Mycobacterium sp.]|uniref:sensor domain-containing protein n=1 Tax=Mycobacterium sp. TaxID=1785 RepID=UPI002D8A971B|nr:sensor domain-containing protein [Mycobacterium sp.]